jgi:sporulation protein YlmC with PRC-barrel domain
MASRTTDLGTGRGTSEFRRILSAGTLEGDRIRNSAGEDLGKLEDIMIDVTSGRVAYAVLSFGGFLGIGNKLFAIPWQTLKLDEVNHEFILDVDRNTLENAPGFDKDNWPDMADPDFGNNVYNYYGYKPYWDTTTTTTGADDLDRMERDRNFDRDRNRTLKGGGSGI